MLYTRGRCGKLLSAAALLLLVLSPAVVAQPTLEGWTTDGAAGLELVAVGFTPPMMVFSLKNVSGRIITAFAASVGPKSAEHYYDSFASQASVAPGGVHALRVGVQAHLPSSDHVLHLLAVMFEDGTAEGASPQIDFIRMKRLGRTLETQRIHNLLKQTVGGENLMHRSISSIAADIGVLPESPEAALSSVRALSVAGMSANQLHLTDKHSSFGFLGGIREAREAALRKIAEVQQNPIPASEEAFLSQMADDYSRMSAAYQDTIERTRKGRPQ